MYGRLIVFMVFVLLALMATAFAFNWLWVKAFGPGGGPGAQQPQVTRQESAKERKEREKEHREKVKASIEKNKHSDSTLAKAAESATPRALTAAEYDPKTGTATWPPLLSDTTFDEARQRLEQALATNAENPGRENRSRAQTSARLLLDQLKTRIRDFRTSDYLAARDYLERLAHMLKTPE